MDDSQQKELWEFVGSAKEQFKSNTELLTSIKTDIGIYHKKVDKHLTLHKWVHRGIYTVVGALFAWWKA